MGFIGRPRLFKSVEEFEERAEKYFRENEGGNITWTGLCLAVGASSRQALERYKRGEHGEDFVDSIKKALLIVENNYELSLKENGRSGDIFALKNFGWEDKIKNEVQSESTIKHKVTADMTAKEAAQAFKEQIRNS